MRVRLHPWFRGNPISTTTRPEFSSAERQEPAAHRDMATPFREYTDQRPPITEPARVSEGVAQDALDVLAELAHDCVLLSRAADSTGLLRFHRLRRLIHEICEEILVCEAKTVPREAILRAVEPARSVHASSPFVRRIQDWPRGYTGDFETIQRIMKPVNRAEKGSIGYLCESYWLTSPMAQQIRNRMAVQASCILERCAEAGSLRVLSMGCGGCSDLQSIMTPLANMIGSHDFFLTDRDPEARSAAGEVLGRIAGLCRWLDSESSLTPASFEEFAPYDLIVTGIMFDTLENRDAVSLLRQADRLLAPGGRILFTNIAAPNPYRPLMEYLASWILIERAEDDLQRLCSDAGIASERLSMCRDGSGLAILAEVIK